MAVQEAVIPLLCAASLVVRLQPHSLSVRVSELPYPNSSLSSPLIDSSFRLPLVFALSPLLISSPFLLFLILLSLFLCLPSSSSPARIR